MSAASQYYSVTARVGVPHRHEVEVTVPLVGPAGATGPAGAAGASAWNDITGKPSTFAPSAHTHTANEITSGTLDNARINFAAPAAIGSTTPNTGAFASIRVDPKNGGTGSLVVGSTTGGETNQIVLDLDGIKMRAPGSDQVATIAAPTLLSENRSYQLPNASGTLALTEPADNVFRVVGSANATKKVAFEVDTLVDAATTRTLTVPNSSGTIALNETFASPPAIGNTTPSTGAFTTLTATPAAGSTALTLTGGTVTASAPLIDASQTWNASGTTFTGVRFNITNTQSASASVPFDFQIGGSSFFQIRRDGTGRFGSTDIGGYSVGSNNGGFTVKASTGCGWNMSGTTITTEICTLVEQRHGTNAQESRLYGTYTTSTNYQRMTIKSVKQTLSALSGASATTTGTFIPDGAVVVGVTTRVSTALTGATGYQVGDGTDADRWGDINAFALNTTSDNANWTAGTIECFTAGGEITLTAKDSNFTAGAVEICVFYLAGQAD